ncbi:hypothetical protein C8F01DRAFT_1078480 [Mycena amicta]|nr:hypothetical protein C8F01DRAFT_1078480 [Mycena amicta]
MRPAEATSTVRGDFPVQQPSPVKAIQRAFRMHAPTAFDLSPAHANTPAPAEAGPSRFPGALDSPSTPSTPIRHSIGDENVDPFLERSSPSQHVRIAYSELAATRTGSLLLSKSKLTPETSIIHAPVFQSVPTTIPLPDWTVLRNIAIAPEPETRAELAHENTAIGGRDAVIEAANATMVYQNMHLGKLNEALYEKEEGKKRERASLFKGKAQCLSSDEFMAALEDHEQAKKDEIARKKAAKDGKAARKVASEALELRWKQMKQEHEGKVREWEAECAELSRLGARKKDLPPKPKLGLKPKLPAAVVDEEEADEEESDDDAE